MKRIYRVSIDVEVGGEEERDFEVAVAHLYDSPPFMDVISVGVDGSFNAKTKPKTVSVRRKK